MSGICRNCTNAGNKVLKMVIMRVALLFLAVVCVMSFLGGHPVYWPISNNMQHKTTVSDQFARESTSHVANQGQQLEISSLSESLVADRGEHRDERQRLINAFVYYE